MLEKGQPIIPFVAEDLNGHSVDISQYAGQKLYLAFFRKAACPFCNMAIHTMIQQHRQFQDKGIAIVALFASPKEELLKYAGKQQAPFPIIPDGDFEIYKQYGIQVSYGGMVKTMVHPGKVVKAMTGGFFSLRSTLQDPVLPADFLVGADQNVREAHYGRTFDDHISVADILAFDWSRTG